MSLPYFDAAAIEAATPYPKLVAAIGDAFRDGGVATTRNISTVRVWGRSPEKAATIAKWARDNITDDAAVATDLDRACGSADVISAATFATTPLIRGASLRAGVHVDLVGAYSPGMRETDAEVFRRADQVWVDTFEGAESEAGDLLAAIEEGAIELDDVAGDLFELARLAGAARHDAREITVFKSVGTGLEDLAAAILCETG